MLLFRAMATVTGMTLISRVAGFVRDVLTAKVLGAGVVADAFFVALKLPNFFRRITAEGAFSVAFVPLYSKKVETEGQASATDFAADTFAFMTAFLLPFVVIAIAIMPWVIFLIAPGFHAGDPRADLAIDMTRVTFPYLLFMSIAALLGGMLNSAHRFYPFAFAPVIFNGCLIVALLLAGSHADLAGPAMAWGITISGVLQMVWLWHHVGKLGIKIPVLRMPRFTADVKRLLMVMGPGIIGAGVMQINVFIDVMIASTLETGAISHLYYADRLNQLPLGTVGIAVSTALLPLLSQAIAVKDDAQSNTLFNRALEVTLALALPAAIALFVIAAPIMQVLFERGEFTAQDTAVTAAVLMGYAVGLPAYIIAKVYASVYWSNHDTMTPVKIAIGVAVVNTALAFVFSRFMGAPGIALATGLVGWLQVALFVWGTRANPIAAFDARMKKSWPKIAIACTAMAATLWAGQALTAPYMAQGGLMRYAAFLALMGAGGGVYMALAFGLKLLTFDDLKVFLTRPKNLSSTGAAAQE